MIDGFSVEKEDKIFYKTSYLNPKLLLPLP